MSQLRTALEGVHNYLPTPFYPDYRLNSKGMAGNVAHYADTAAQNQTVVVGGGYGEGWKLDVEEHRAVVKAAVDGSQGKILMMAGVIAGYRNAWHMARNAETAGADAVIVFPPPDGFPDSEGSFLFFREIAKAICIGVVVFLRQEFWPEVLQRLGENENVIRFLPPRSLSPGFYDHVAASLDRLDLRHLLWIAENEPAAMLSFPLGTRSYTTAAAAFVPGACRDLWQQGTIGNRDAMIAVTKNRIDPVLRIRSYRPGYGISGVKAALELLGGARGPVRPPGTQVLAEDRQGIAEILRMHSEVKRLGPVSTSPAN